MLRVMFHRSTLDVYSRSASPCKGDRASIWRAESAVSVPGQLVLCEEKRGEVLVMVTWSWDPKAESCCLISISDRNVN